jgi:SAM-dependent methyltransferase
MVHALRETNRVLKPDGLLIDLRPAPVHRRVGFVEADEYRMRWVMRESFEDDLAADAAVEHVVAEGWFRAVGRKRFACFRVMDRLAEFEEWLTDFVVKGDFPSHDWLVERLRRELERDGKKKIVVGGPLILRALRKAG